MKQTSAAGQSGSDTEETLRLPRADGLMRSAVFVGQRQTEIREVPIPEPREGEVRVSLEGCGVCASNLPVWEGRPWFKYPAEPGTPGHEGWGRIDALGDGVTGFNVGQRVAFLSNHAYAEYDVAPAEAVVPIPDRLVRMPMPGEPLGCAVNVFERSDIRPGHRVAIVGLGFLGILLTSLSKLAGAHVVVLSRREFALELARAYGAEETIDLNDHRKALDRSVFLSGGIGFDRVIEATGKAAPLKLASELTAVRGKLIIAGYHQDGAREINMQLWNWRGIDVINAHERETKVYVRGITEAVRAIEAGRFNPAPLFTHRVPLEHVNDALQLAYDQPEGYVKALVTM